MEPIHHEDIIVKFLDPVEKQIINEIRVGRGIRTVYVSEFKRYGRSGAKLLLLYFAEPPAMPFLLKISSCTEIKKEHDAIISIRGLVECGLEDTKMYPKEPKGDRAALLYKHLATDSSTDASQPITLAEILFTRKHNWTTKLLKEAIDETFRKLRNAHTATKIEHVNVESHFSEYFREHKSESRIKCVLGLRKNEDTFQFMRSSVNNPLKLIENLPHSLPLPIGRIHGDLHPENIVLDRNQISHIVDFRWAEKHKCIYVDHTLLENSIRFWNFPRHANLEEQQLVDKLLLDEYGWQNLQQYYSINKQMSHCYERLANLVGMIRINAREAAEIAHVEFSMNDYLLTQFIMLYGGLSFDNYNPYTSTRALCLMAQKLSSTSIFS